MNLINVAVYGNRTLGPYNERTADLLLVGQFQLPDLGSSMLALEYVVGQINNRSRAKFVAPIVEQLGRNIRTGDAISLDGKDYLVTGPNQFEEYKVA
ncbi:hypothetical protein SEA_SCOOBYDOOBYDOO_64 [Mycobacterium phage ScoobyDoobyDoo]|nr:hypothetical protein SEA_SCOOBYDOOBYDOO_64 [Mycobacterium phage ScoobyDoobyDoo]